MEIVLVGSSAAAYSALRTLRQAGFDEEVTCISRDRLPFYSRIPLPDFICGEKDEAGLSMVAEYPGGLGHLHMLTGAEVTRVAPAESAVYMSDGRRVQYDKLIICSGANPKTPGQPVSGPGVFTLRHLEDALRIRELAEKGRRAVVVGGGLVSVKAAAALWKRGVAVKIIVKSSHLLSQMLDAEAASFVESVLRNAGIEIVTGSDVVNVVRDSHGLRQAVLQDESVEPCDLIIYGKGVAPNIRFLESSGIECRSGILTDSRMRTNVPNVYAAGDVAEAPDFFSGEPVVRPIWPAAVRQGQVAARTALGIEDEYEGSLPVNVTGLFGLPFASVGVTRPGPGREVIIERDPSGRSYGKAVLEEGRLVGAVLVGDVTAAGALHWLVRTRQEVRVRDRLFWAPLACQSDRLCCVPGWPGGCRPEGRV